MIDSSYLKRYGMSGNTIPLYHTVDMTVQDWEKARSNIPEGAEYPCTLGGSEVASIAGVNKWKDIITLYHEKATDTQPEFDEDTLERFEFGHAMEDVAAKIYTKRFPEHIVQKHNYILGNSEIPYARANLDRLVQVDGRWGVMEMKNISEYAKDSTKGEEGEFAIPEYYEPQVQWYMGITGLKFCIFVAVLGGNRLRTCRVDFDEEQFDYLKETTKNFIRSVAEKRPPKNDHDNTYPGWQLVTPTDGETVEVFEHPKVLDLLIRLKGLNDAKKDLEARIDTEKAYILEYLGGSVSVLTYQGKKIMNTIPVKSSKFDRKGFEKMNPGVLDDFVTKTESKQIRFTLNPLEK